jgi:hypothetical protein
MDYPIALASLNIVGGRILRLPAQVQFASPRCAYNRLIPFLILLLVLVSRNIRPGRFLLADILRVFIAADITRLD